MNLSIQHNSISKNCNLSRKSTSLQSGILPTTNEKAKGVFKTEKKERKQNKHNSSSNKLIGIRNILMLRRTLIK